MRERHMRGNKTCKLAGRLNCTGCGACVDACSRFALGMVYDGEGFAFPQMDSRRCVECGACSRACPVLNPPSSATAPGYPLVFAGWSATRERRAAGSSGGVFAELAAATVAGGGRVAGARTDGLTIRHDLAETAEDALRFSGSKYLQSETCGIYRRVLERINNGQDVLFSGTPCQVAGMLNMCESKSGRDRLTTCEVVCHGVPSRRFWTRYVEETRKSSTAVVSFRDKKEGWLKSFAMTFKETGSGTPVRSSFREGDLFLRAFLKGLILRNSCYDCPFAALPRLADITLADFWGLRRFPAEQADGVSLVIVNSKRGMDLLQSIPLLTTHPVEWDEALPANPRVVEGASKLPWRSFVTRRHLELALRFCSLAVLDKLFTGRIPKWQFWWWPYKLAWRFRARSVALRSGVVLAKTAAPLAGGSCA